MDKTTKTTKTSVDRLLMQLERNQSMVFKFIKKLNSYKCEPTDYECFVTVGRLKQNLKQLAADQQDVLVKDRKILMGNKNAPEKLEGYLEHFLQLKQEMEAYLRLSRSHR